MPVTAKALVAPLALAALLAAGCTAPRQDGPLYREGTVSVPGTFYAELFDAERKRWYLFLTPQAAEAARDGAREMPLSKTLIGAGPERATVVIEQVADKEVNANASARVLATFKARHPAAK